MRLLTADYIFPIISEPVKNGYLLLDEDQTIIGIFTEEEILNGKEIRVNNQTINFLETRPEVSGLKLETYKGILCPGFINTHCHIELSYLKGLIPEKTGLDGFVKHLQSIRKDFIPEQIQEAIISAENEMLENGIVAVGDICNGDSTFEQKSKGNLKYHSFIEIFGFDPAKAEATMEHAIKLENNLRSFCGNNASVSITPHAPYSVSEKLFKKIGERCYPEGGLISIHNQETEEENILFKSKTGKMAEMLQHFGLNLSNWKASGFNSLPSVVSLLPKCNKFLFVHNTFTSPEDIDWAHNYSKMVYWCFCPNANMYIENKLPEITRFLSQNCKITLGTDSLASNHSLSILEEMKSIQNKYPEIGMHEMLVWATKNGADYLGFNELGAFEHGRKPGVNLISNIDLDTLSFIPDSQVRKLV